MNNLDFRFYFAIFLRRLPYFLVIVALLSAVGITVAAILPPVYRSQANLLVEPQQIPGDLAQSTVPVNPFEQIQIIQQRLMTRDNLLELADRIGMYDDQPELTAGAIAGDLRRRVQFIGIDPTELRRAPGTPGATFIGIAFEAPTPEFANKGANELVTLVLQENVRMRTGQAGDTLDFFEAEVERLSGAIERQAARISDFKTENVEALPDSLAARRAEQQREQERLLALEREESALRNQRATVVWVYQRTGRAATVGGALSPEEQELQALKSQLIQSRAIYASSSPRVRTLETRIAALEELVEEQRAARALPGADGEAAAPTSELELELAPIDARLEFITEDKALIEARLAALETSIQATPRNEMLLTGMERELANLQRQYETAANRLGQAGVGERLEVLSKGERFTLIDEPGTPGSPVRPRRALIAGLGVMGGVTSGIGFILLLELLNRSIRRPVELSNRLGIQTLATVPYIRSTRERRWKRGLVVLSLLLVGVVIPAGLFALHSYYLPLDLLFGQLLEQVGMAPPIEPES